MGAAGAALATAISQSVSFLMLLSVFILKKSIISIHPRHISRRLSDYWLIVSTGFPTLCRQGLASIATVLINIKGKLYGDAAVAALTIANKVYLLIRNIIIGIGQGFQPIAGYNYGSGHPDRLKEVFTLVMRIDVFIGFIAMTIGLSIPGLIGRLFTSDMELISMVKPCMRWLTVMMPLICMTITNSQFFMAVDKPWISIVTSLSRQVIFLLPMIYIVPAIFTHFGGDGLTGLWVSNTISDVTGAVLAVSLLLTQLRIFREAK